MAAPHFTVVELTGHIIDSLTLTKVIDKIQTAGGRYQINDLQIGEKKNDFSTAQISVWTDNQATLDAILDELKPYGALPVENSPIQLAPCPAEGTLPEGAYTRHLPPTEILYEGRWISVSRENHDHVIVLAPGTQAAQFREACSLKAGELVVLGHAGVKVLPTLGAKADAATV
jgi:hypothetical protein